MPLQWFKILCLVTNLAVELNSVSRKEGMTLRETVVMLERYFESLDIDFDSTTEQELVKMLNKQLDKFLNDALLEQFKCLARRKEKG